MKINDINFVDLYLGEDFADVTGLSGAAGRVSVPDNLKADVIQLKSACLEKYKTNQDDEFFLNIAGVIYRVSQYKDILDKSVFTIRRSAAAIRSITSLGLSAPVQKMLLDRNLRGLVLIAGEMASGKTSTAASVIVERLKQHGGVAMAIEDPPETALNGIHGNGRCIQVATSRKTGGYKDMLIRAMRSGAINIFVGEIRDDETAMEVLRASINGHFIIATIHAGSAVQAIERLQTFCLSHSPNTNQILAEGLSLVIWQKLEKISIPPTASDPAKIVSRLKAEFLIINNEIGVKSKIREGKIDALIHEMKEQATKIAWLLANQG